MATATSLSEELLTLKEEMGWSWSEMASQVEGALNVKGPSGSTLFRYAKGQANPSDLVEQTVLNAIQTIRENQLAEAEIEPEESNVSERSITEVEKAEVVEATEEILESEQDVIEPEEAVETGEDAETATEVEHEVPVSPWNPEALSEVPFALGLVAEFEIEAVVYPELEEPTAHGAGIVVEEPVETQFIQWGEFDENLPFAHGLSLTPVAEHVVEEIEEAVELNEENEVDDESDEEILLDPDYDIGEAGVLEHFEIDVIMEAQMALERDELGSEELVVVIEATQEVTEEVIEEEPEPEIDSRDLLDTLYENPSVLKKLTPARYFIFDESIEMTEMPTLAELGVASLAESAGESLDSIEVGEISEPLIDEEASLENEVEIRVIAPFGEGSLYANGSTEIDLEDCPKAREYSARSREIFFALPEGK